MQTLHQLQRDLWWKSGCHVSLSSSISQLNRSSDQIIFGTHVWSSCVLYTCLIKLCFVHMSGQVVSCTHFKLSRIATIVLPLLIYYRLPSLIKIYFIFYYRLLSLIKVYFLFYFRLLSLTKVYFLFYYRLLSLIKIYFLFYNRLLSLTKVYYLFTTDFYLLLRYMSYSTTISY